MYGTVVALKQHLGNTRRSTEVAVDLEGRVCIEEVGESAPVGILASGILRGKQTQHVLQNGQGMGAVEHTCPETDFPSETPSRGLVTAVSQCLFGRCEEFVVTVGADLVGGIQPIKMGDVTVMGVAAVSVDKPLLKLFATADLHGWKQSQRLFKFFLILSVLAKDTCRLQRIRQSVEHYLVVHRAASGNRCRFAGRSLFGTHRRHNHKPVLTFSRCGVVGMRHHEVQVKIRSTLDNRIPFAKEIHVACVEVVLPKVSGEPCAAIGIHAPECTIDGTCNAPQVGVMVGHPSTTPVHEFGRSGTRLTQVAYHPEEWFVGLREVSDFRRPVVHLGIDVDGVFRIPRRVFLVVP